MICKNCGAQISEGKKFCTSCGARVQPGEQIYENAVPKKPAAKKVVTKPTAIHVPPQEKKQTNKTMLVIIVLVFAVPLIGSFVYRNLKSGNDIIEQVVSPSSKTEVPETEAAEKVEKIIVNDDFIKIDWTATYEEVDRFVIKNNKVDLGDGVVVGHTAVGVVNCADQVVIKGSVYEFCFSFFFIGEELGPDSQLMRLMIDYNDSDDKENQDEAYMVLEDVFSKSFGQPTDEYCVATMCWDTRDTHVELEKSEDSTTHAVRAVVDVNPEFFEFLLDK